MVITRPKQQGSPATLAHLPFRCHPLAEVHVRHGATSQTECVAWFHGQGVGSKNCIGHGIVA